MQKFAGLPVVVGSSMSGLLVSLSLSRHGVEHILIGGDEPADVPRLGESLNECAGPELWRWFGPKYQQYFYTKSHISLFSGQFATMIHIGNPHRRLTELVRLQSRGGRTPLQACVKGLLHVDRIGLDRAVYHEARSSSLCRFVAGRVDRFRYNANSDRLEEIHLEDGAQITQPRFVFDATGPRGLVAEATGVGRECISNRQCVVWTHYLRSEQDRRLQHWWMYGTNLLRLDRDTDQINGIAWLIPLGNALSVGVSVDADEAENHAADEIIQMLADAYRRRGIDYTGLFPRQREIQQLKHQYFVRERAYGANWLLASGTFLQVWFPSSAGLWTTTASAGMAPDMIREPDRFGSVYEAMMRRLLTFHGLLDQMVHGQPFDGEMDAYWFWSRWLAGIPQRVSDYLRISNRELNRRRPGYTLLSWITRQFVRFPSGALTYWGLFLIRVRRVSDLSRQAEAFPAYFRPARFRARNYAIGITRLWRCLLTWQWSKRRWD